MLQKHGNPCFGRLQSGARATVAIKLFEIGEKWLATYFRLSENLIVARLSPVVRGDGAVFVSALFPNQLVGGLYLDMKGKFTRSGNFKIGKITSYLKAVGIEDQLRLFPVNKNPRGELKEQDGVAFQHRLPRDHSAHLA